jgi:hypothetical protein
MLERRSPGRYKSKFTAQEDSRLLAVVSQGYCRAWSEVALQMGGRNPRQCRERWNNYVNPAIITTPWTDAEDRMLDAKFAELGPRWQIIARFFPERSKNQVKNHWMTKQRRLNKKRREQQDAIAKQRAREIVKTARDQPPPHPDEGPFQQEARDDPFWDMIAFDFL